MNASVFRPACVEDAAALLALQLALDAETRLMMLEPDERPAGAGATAAHLEDVLTRANCVLLVADGGAELAGYVEAEGGTYRRNRHSAALVLGVRQRSAGRGTGRALLQAVIDWAPTVAVSRMERTVMAHNAAAISLYRRMGFVVEGRRRRSLMVDGVPVDELAMARVV